MRASASRFVLSIAGALCLIAANYGVHTNLAAQPVSDVLEDSILNLSFREFQRNLSLRGGQRSQGESLASYAAKCAAATGITIPRFNCSAGVEVPGQGTTPNGSLCNVLNGVCDPGSRFQVLPGRTEDAVAVAHCRKDGQPIEGTDYNDIAIIQYNKANGAVCFFQALTGLPGQNIPAPAEGQAALWSDGATHWKSPAQTEGIGCTGCHDNGGFIRSNYLRQLDTLPHRLPSDADGFTNKTSPLRYVGADFSADRSWSIETAPAPGDTDPPCNSCHRLAVNNHPVHGIPKGTAYVFATLATAIAQKSKAPHSASSPIWMRPNRTAYDPLAEASAQRYRDCAVAFVASNFTSAPPDCRIEPLGLPWEEPVAPPTPSISAVLVDYLADKPDPTPVIYYQALP
jgi:hypothetical protein